MIENSSALWKSAFLTLPDAAFFDILRNYLGDFKTPFNKHSLLETLEAFIRKPETRKRILSLIDKEDARILTAIHLLGSPTHEALHRFFEGETSYLDLHHSLLNLQDRLLVYAERSTGDEKLLLNPLLSEELLEEVIDIGLLIRSRPAPESEHTSPWLNDSLLTALLSFLLERKDILKSDGGLRKKTEMELQEIFPDLFQAPLRLDRLLKSFTHMGLLRRKENAFDVDTEAWREAADLEVSPRTCLIIRCADASDLLEAWKEAEWLHGFLQVIGDGNSYTKPGLLRYMRLLAHEAGKLMTITETWIDDLILFGALVSEDGEYFHLNPSFFTRAGDHAEESSVIIEPNFEVTAKPHISLSEGLPLAASCTIVQYDLFPKYDLSKTSFSRALGLGWTSGAISQALSRLSGFPLPQNISFSLGEWEKEYSSVSLIEGVVILADEDRRHLLDHHKEFRRLIKLNPAPGVYITDSASLSRFLRLLGDSGVEILPQARNAADLTPLDTSADTKELFSPEVPDLAGPFEGRIIYPWTFTPTALSGTPFNSTAAWVQKDKTDHAKNLYAALEESGLPDDQAGEIRERIRRKLILFPEQIGSSTTRRERMEAKGLNYVGKVLVIEQALASSSDYLEIVRRTADGSPDRILARPGELKKTGTDLLLLAHTIPDNTPVEIPVKKISLVRRLRGFLIG